MCDLTNHAYDRYCERILKIPLSEIPEYLKIQENKDDIKVQISNIMDKSIFLIKAEYQGQQDNNYYIHDNVVYVVNPSGQCIVTCYVVNFSFGNKMDRIITDDLIAQILVEQRTVQAIELEVLESRDKNDTNIENLNRQIASLETQLESLKQSKHGLEVYGKSLVSKQVLANEKLKGLCYKIVYSVNYGLDKLVNGNGKK